MFLTATARIALTVLYLLQLWIYAFPHQLQQWTDYHLIQQKAQLSILMDSATHVVTQPNKILAILMFNHLFVFRIPLTRLTTLSPIATPQELWFLKTAMLIALLANINIFLEWAPVQILERQRSRELIAWLILAELLLSMLLQKPTPAPIRWPPVR